MIIWPKELSQKIPYTSSCLEFCCFTVFPPPPTSDVLTPLLSQKSSCSTKVWWSCFLLNTSFTRVSPFFHPVLGVWKKVCLKHVFSKIFALKHSLFLRSYSRLKFTFKMLASIALVNYLRLYTWPWLEWDHTANTLIPFPSKPDPQVAKIRTAPSRDLPWLPHLRSWQKKNICRHPVSNNGTFSALSWKKKRASIRFPWLWRW